MNAPFVIAQVTPAPVANPPRVIKLTKPQGDQAVVVYLSYDGTVKVDFSEIANERITLVRVGERVVILFLDSKATITLDPFFDSLGRPLDNVTYDVGPGREMTGVEFAGIFPITTDQTILPAAGDQQAQNTDGPYGGPVVDPLGPSNPLPLLPPEELPNFQVNLEVAPVNTDQGDPSAEDSFPTINGNELFIDDEGQFEGIPGAIGALGDVAGEQTGFPPPDQFLSFSFGADGPGDIVFEPLSFVVQDASGNPVPLQALVFDPTLGGGQWVTVNVDVAFPDAQTVVGTWTDSAAGVHDAFLLQITDTTTGAYTFQASVAFVHPFNDPALTNTPGSEFEDNLFFQIDFTVTDIDLEQDTATLRIGVNDDTPDAITASVPGSFDGDIFFTDDPIDDEDQLPAFPAGSDGIQNGFGDDGAGTQTSGVLNVQYGADGPSTDVNPLEISTGVVVNNELDANIGQLNVVFVDGDGNGVPEPVTTQWVDNPAGGGTLYGTSTNFPDLVNPVFTLVIDVNGNYTFTAFAPLSHPLTNDPNTPGTETEYEDNLNLVFNYTATDGDGDQTLGTITVNVDDDTPDTLSDTAEVTEGGQGTVNLVIIIDRSGSMVANPDGPGGFATRLELAQAAAINLINTANVNQVMVVSFDDTANINDDGGLFWTSAADAISYINGLTPGGATNYDDPLELVQSSWGAGPTAADQTLVFFMSDGEPNRPFGDAGIDGTEEQTWIDFLANQGVANSYAIGIGNDVSSADDDELEPVAWHPGENDDGDIIDGALDPNVIVINTANEADLVNTLINLLPGAVAGNVLDNDGFGADGLGGIVSIVVNGVTYTYDPDTGLITGGAPGTDAGNGTLEVVTTLGGHLTFHFTDVPGHPAGDWQYLSPETDIPPEGELETFTYSIVDGDGDGQTAELNIEVLDNPVPTAGTENAFLDDEGLPGGIPGTPAVGDDVVANVDADNNESTYSGTLPFNFFTDIPGVIRMVDGSETVGGVPYTYDANAAGDTLTASAGGTDYFTVTLNTATGEYTLVLLEAIPHPIAGTEDNLVFNLGYEVQDSNGDVATGSLVIDIDDDVPTISASDEDCVDQTLIYTTIKAGHVDERGLDGPNDQDLLLSGIGQNNNGINTTNNDIGVGNQWIDGQIDHPNSTDPAELLRLDFVNSVSFTGPPDPAAFNYNGHYLVDAASFTIHQIQGNPGNTATVFVQVFDANDDTDFTNDGSPLPITLADVTVDTTGSGEPNFALTSVYNGATLIGVVISGLDVGDRVTVNTAADFDRLSVMNYDGVTANTSSSGDPVTFSGDSLGGSPFAISGIESVSCSPITLTVSHDESLGFTPQSGPNPENDVDPGSAPAVLTAAIAGAGIPTVLGYAESTDAVTSLFTAPDYGSDGPGGVTYQLSTSTAGGTFTGEDSGLNTTVGDNDILLYSDPSNPNIVWGIAGGDLLTGDRVFALYIDDTTGHLWIAQFEAIAHDTDGATAAEHDDFAAITSGLIFVSAVVTDGDGDQAYAVSPAGLQISFQDDGPSVTAESICADESPTNGPLQVAEVEGNDTLATAQVIALSQFTVGPNPDVGNPLIPWLSISGFVSSGQDEDLYRIHLLAGETITFDIDYGMFDVDTILTLFNAAGIALTGNDDGGTGPGGGGSAHPFDSFLTFPVTTTGDYYIGVSSFPNFAGNGPTYGNNGGSAGDYVLNISLDTDRPVGGDCAPILVHDETEGVQTLADPNAQNDVLGSALPVLALFNAITDRGIDPDVGVPDNNAIGFARSGAGISGITFTPDYGSDGPGASPVYALTIPGANGTVDSGVDTTDGRDIYLFLQPDGLVVGRVDLDDSGTADADDPAAFAVAIDPVTGEVFSAQYLSLSHPLFPSTFDEPVLLADNAVQVVVTVTDGDGDTATANAVGIGHLIAFQDDGPSVVADSDSVSAAPIQIVTFDDIPLGEGIEQLMPSGHAGFTWAQAGVYNPGLPGYAPHSDPNLAFIGEADGLDHGYPGVDGSPVIISRAADFTPVGGWFSATFTDALPITFEAWDDGVLQGTQTVNVDQGGPTYIDFSSFAGFNSIDELRIDTTNGPNAYFGFDDFTFANDVPNATGNVVTGADGGLGSDANISDGSADDAGTDGFGSIAWTNAVAQDGGLFTVAGLYGTLTVDALGNYSYDLNEANPTVIGLSDIDPALIDTFTYALTDGDGDTDDTTLTINVTGADDGVGFFNLTPAINGGDATVDEEDLSDGSSPSAPALTQIGTFNFTAPDGVDDLTVGGALVVTNGVVTLPAPIVTTYGLLTITGVDLPTGVVSYSYTLTDNTFAHGPADDGQDSVFDNIAVSLTDTDDEVANSTLAIRVIDDVPDAIDDTDSVGDGTFTDGNVITGVGTTNDPAGDDVPGADGATVTGVAVGNTLTAIIDGTGVGGLGVPGTHGTLVLNSNGSYTYTRDPDDVVAGTDTFTYTLTDGDGDTDTATLIIDLDNRNLLIVGSNEDDEQGSQFLHTVPNPAGPLFGIIDGDTGDDILVGDPGATPTIGAGQSGNFVFVLDISGSMTEQISFGNTTITRLEAMQQAVVAALQDLAGSAADAVRVHIVSFDTNSALVGTFDLIVGGEDQNGEVGDVLGNQLQAAIDAVNALNDAGSTNYESGLAQANEWIEDGTVLVTDALPFDNNDGEDGGDEINTTGQVLVDQNDVRIAIVSAWTDADSLANAVGDAPDDDDDGDGIATGWGVRVSSGDTINGTEILRFDFGAFNDFASGGDDEYDDNGDAAGFHGSEISSATFTFRGFTGTPHTVNYTIFFVGGGSELGSHGFAGATSGAHVIAGTGANLGSQIAYIEFTVGGGDAGHIDLESVVLASAPIPDADVNQVIFISDGEPNTVLDDDGDPSSASAAAAIAAAAGVIGEIETDGDGAGIDQVFEIEAVGIALGNTEIDGSDGGNDANLGGGTDDVVILSADGTDIAYVSAWSNSVIDVANLVDATDQGDGITADGAPDDQLNGTEVLRFDFGAGTDYDGAGVNYSTLGFNGPDVLSAAFTFDDNNGGGDTVFAWTIHFVGGATETGSQTVTNDENATLAGTGINLGSFIDYIEFNVTSGQGRVDLQSVVTAGDSPAMLILDQVEGPGGDADNIDTAEQLAALLADLTGGSGISGTTGSDIINGLAGSDLIYGDVLFTNDVPGPTLADHSGWAVFAELETGLVPLFLGWDRADTVAYILANHYALSSEMPRTGGHDVIAGGAGDDLIYAQEGDDTINYFITALGNDGTDFVHGGSEITEDSLVITSTATAAEDYFIETVAEWELRTGDTFALPAGIPLAEGLLFLVSLGTQILAATYEIEDVLINAGAGDDTLTVSGDFSGTSLLNSTINYDGGAGDDTLDLSGRDSAHRVVADGGSGGETPAGDTVILDFAYSEITGVTPVAGGFEITHNGITDVFTNFESFQFEGGVTLSYTDLITPPGAPSIASVTDNVAPVTGTVADGGTTNDPTLLVRVSLTGTGALAGDSVQLFNGVAVLGVAVVLSAVNIANTWVEITTPALANGTTNDLNAQISDLFGLTSAASADHTVTIDTSAPTVSISVDDTALNIGDDATVTFTFSEVPTGFTVADVTVANGSIGAISPTGNPLVFTATLTPAAGITDATNVITVGTVWSDPAGNAPAATTDSNNYAVDTVRPTVAITLSDTALAAGETSLVTFTFSEAPTNFTVADVTAVPNGALSGFTVTGNPLIYTATFTPTASVTDTSNIITVGTAWSDAAGNAPLAATDSGNFTIDTVRPTVSISVGDTALNIGDDSPVTFTFSEVPTGFTVADVTVANGSIGAISPTGDPLVFTAILTPTAGVTDTTNVITVGTVWTNPAGNAPAATTDSNNYAVDTVRPTVSISVDDTALNIGDDATVTFTFSEVPTGFTVADVTVANGSIGAISPTGNPLVFTAILTPTAGVTDATNVITVGTVWSDPASNVPAATTDSNNYAVDTVRPDATIVVTDNNLLAGETSLVTITFTEAVTGFANGDLTIENGTLTPVSSGDGGITWTATFTPTTPLVDANNAITLNDTLVTDLAGNAGTGTSVSNNYAINTAPVVTATGETILLNNDQAVLPEWLLLLNDTANGAVDVQDGVVTSPTNTSVTHTNNGNGDGTLALNFTATDGSFQYRVEDAGANLSALVTATLDRPSTTEDATINGGVGADIVFGFGGTDTLQGAGGDDTYAFRSDNDGTDSINDTAGTTDRIVIGTLGAAITGLNFERTNSTDLQILYNGETINVLNHYGADNTAGGVGAIEQMTFVGGATYLGYAIDGNPYTVNSIRNGATDIINGTGGNDIIADSDSARTLNGGAGNDLLFGNGGGNILIGGDGADFIDTGEANDDVLDIVRFLATTEFGDRVVNFDVTGTPDRIEFGGTLNGVYDDVTNDDNFQFNAANAVGNNTDQAVNLNAVEALFLDGAANNGVTNANLGNATAVAAEFSAEFGITAAATADALLVINDTDANSFAVWHYVEAAGAAGGASEILGTELTLIGIFDGNGAIATGNLDLVP